MKWFKKKEEKRELEEEMNWYVLDWDKVETLEDLKKVMKKIVPMSIYTTESSINKRELQKYFYVKERKNV